MLRLSRRPLKTTFCHQRTPGRRGGVVTGADKKSEKHPRSDGENIISKTRLHLRGMCKKKKETFVNWCAADLSRTNCFRRLLDSMMAPLTSDHEIIRTHSTLA